MDKLTVINVKKTTCRKFFQNNKIMRRNLLYIALCATSLWAMTACSDDAIVQEKNEDITSKTPIELSVGVADEGITRAVITNGTNKTQQAMDNGTGIWLSMKSTYDSNLNSYDWHYKGTDTGIKYCTTNGSAGAAIDNKAPITFATGNTRYWDDAHARSSMLDIWGVAVPGKAVTDWGWKSTSSGSNIVVKTWSTTEGDAPTDVYWAISNPQTSETFAKEDLCFSNNLVDYTSASSSDCRLKFNPSTHKFAGGNMIFYHALSKITIHIKCGDGFKGDGTDFAFASNTNVALKGFYGKGTLDVKNGEFKNDVTKQDFSSINLVRTTHQKKNDGDYYVLNAYVFPGTDMTNASGATDAFSFIIDGNKYDITLGQLYNAILNGSTNTTKQGASPSKVDASILGGGKDLLAGVNYEFTFTVEKTKISGLTAQVVDWENVEADNITPTNARISLKLEERGSDYVESNVEFYRTKDTENSALTDEYEGYNWTKGYEKNYSSKAYDGTTHKWTFSDWFWPDNTTYYHFRAVGDKSTSSAAAPSVTADETNGDNFSLGHGESYHDYIWGAPMLDDGDNDTDGTFKFYYNATNGFDATGTGSPNATHQIYKGIGPTNATIKLIMFHMMSDVTFNVKTTTGDDAVQLTKESNKVSITLKNIHQAGKVLLGNGLVSCTDTKADYQFTTTPTTTAATSGVSEIQTWSNYGAIPQSLQDVVLVITTPDKNQYEVSMKDVKASSTPSYSNVSYPAYTDNKVNYWYPGVKYTYTFKLSKKKIEDITATILDWEKVEAGDDNVQIK